MSETTSIALQSHAITYGFPNKPPLFSDIDLTLYSGQRLALCGDNGSGKTTLLQTLIGLYKPKKGYMTILGNECRNEAQFGLIRPKVGFLFQDPDDQLFCPTVIEDVCFGPLNIGKTTNDARKIAESALEALDIAHLATRLSHELSGGQKRLVSLAGVLAIEPEILLLDEPTNALDKASVARLIHALEQLPQAMILISHDERILDALADERVELINGSLSKL